MQCTIEGIVVARVFVAVAACKAKASSVCFVDNNAFACELLEPGGGTDSAKPAVLDGQRIACSSLEAFEPINQVGYIVHQVVGVVVAVGLSAMIR